jgi:hypothetical protein
MMSVGAGFGAGVKDSRIIFVFETPNALTNFTDSGWDASGQADAGRSSYRDGWCSGGLPTFLSNRFLRFKHSDFVNVRVFWLLVERRR